MVVDKQINAIKNGKMLAIDPSSGGVSPVGWAVYENGVMLSNGTIEFLHKMNIHERLRALRYCMQHDFDTYDILVIEKIRGHRSHEHLRWAVGTIMCSTKAALVMEMPATTWRAHASPTWVKGDAADAKEIGGAAVKFAKTDPAKIKQLCGYTR